MLENTGERQTGHALSMIKPNHIQRYAFAIKQLHQKFGYKSINVLDSACGNGYGTHMLSLENFHVIGIDGFEDCIEMARTTYQTDFTQFEQVALDNGKEWPFFESRFDAIISIETIEHVKDDLDLVQRYSQSTDFLIATVPNQDIVPFDPEVHKFHVRHYTKQEFETLLNEAGFVVVGWWTQYGKFYPEATVVPGDDGMGLMVVAERATLRNTNPHLKNKTDAEVSEIARKNAVSNTAVEKG